ncbi:MAG: HAMP domain-containing histidine kinase [bacterium]|nr:HAMP domain-containing histidine kinase [bacterium]
MTGGRRGGLQMEIIASLLVLTLAGLTVVAVVMTSASARLVEDAALDRLRLGARQLEGSPGAGIHSLNDAAALARTRSVAALGGHFRVLDDRGFTVGYGPKTPLDSPDLARLIELARVEREVAQAGGVLASDVVLVSRLQPPHGEPGFLIGRVTRDELLSELLPLVQAGAWVLLMAALVFVGFGSYLLRRRIAVPLRDLAAATARVATGDLDVRTEETGPAELAELAHSFNRMAAGLGGQRDALVRAHDSLSRTQRLATVGQLAAGVAHEVGNPVAAILGYTEVTLRDAELSDRSREMSERIHQEALRIRTLVRELLDLGRPKAAELVRIRPHRALEEVARRLTAQKLLDEIDLSVSVDRQLPEIEVDRSRFEQILTNLVENAAHALCGHEEPCIELRAAIAKKSMPERRRADRAGASYMHRRQPDAIAIEVIDNGPGIPAEDLPQVFDPFFTTKDPGEGTGLGLWNAHRMAELLGGSLEVTSRSGETCFRLIVPQADSASEDECSQGTDC